jgi:long-chain acyl-CoA synthetase
MNRGWHVSAQDIRQWTNTHKMEALSTLSLLARKLIVASVDYSSLHFPAWDSVFQPGWDGILKVEKGNEFVPAGDSYWELSTQRGITAEDLEIFLRDAGIGYSTGYGMTEASPILTINPFQDVRVGSCGKPLPGVDIRIHDPDPATGVGEILVRGPNIMEGYYRNEEATAGVFVEDGWLRTGDLGYIDRGGYLYIQGRSKNVIVGPSGENIYPEIIEHQLIKNPYVSQAIVYLRDGRLVARLYLDQEFGHLKLSEPDLRKAVLNLMETIRAETNRQLPAFSAIQDVAEQPEPFELTPTNKVKRYLYTT